MERGKLSPREATPSHIANRPRFLSKDFLRLTGGVRWGRGGKRRTMPGERVPSIWLPEPLAVEGKGAPRQGRRRQASGHPGRSPRREKAYHTHGEGAKPLAARAARCGGKRRTMPRGECAQAPGCPGRLPRREKARCTRGEAAKTSGCLARTRGVLPTHRDIRLQRPALPAPGLNCTSEPK